MTVSKVGRVGVAAWAIWWIFSGADAAAQTRGAASRYTVQEVMVPMRDGVSLYTQVFTPKQRTEPCPILITRTPYEVSPVADKLKPGALGPSPLFDEAGYVFVYQDVRGQFRSEGEWRMLLPPRDPADPAAVDEATDTQDTIDWLLEHVEGTNGRVGMWGISYDAWEAVMAMADAHPALVAVSPQASPADMFMGDDMHHHGAFRLSYTFAWLAFMSARRGDASPALIQPALSHQDAYRFFLEAGSLADIDEHLFEHNVPGWQEVLQHGDYDDFWQRRNVLPHLDDVRPAVLNVAGWFDAEDFRGPIDIYRTVEEEDEDDRNVLVVGPWSHGAWSARTGDTGTSLGHLDFVEETTEWYAEVVEFPFFEFHLRDEDDPWLPEVYAFETGGNVWHELDAWPPEDVQPRALYLHGDGVASFEAPGADGGATAFVSDPHDPVPYSETEPVFPQPLYMVEDQRFLAEREDVISFVTVPLTEDVVIAGRPEVQLRCSTTGTAADWIVKLIDVYPEDSDELSPLDQTPMAGRQILLSGDIFRAKYRNSFERPEPLEPDVVTAVDFTLPDRLHRFRAGHRIMVQIHSTWFPMYDRNPQVAMNIYEATEEDFVTATHRVAHDATAPSRILLPIVEE